MRNNLSKLLALPAPKRFWGPVQCSGRMPQFLDRVHLSFDFAISRQDSEAYCLLALSLVRKKYKQNIRH